MRKLTGYGPSLIVLATAMLVLFLGPTAVQHLTYKQTEARMIQAAHRLESNDVLAQLNQAYEDIAALVEPSVVHISAQQTGPDGVLALSSGSGWVFDVEGHIVTNFHVVRDADRIEVQLSTGELRQAHVIGADQTTDIAVLQIPAGQLHPASLAAPLEPLEQGDLVFAFGSPFDFRFSMSSGIVSGQGRSVDALGPTGYENFIQVDAAINPGNSGGPLTDFRGHVIGMNTAIATGRRGSIDEGQFAGIGLAIPLDMIEPVVVQIISTGVVEKGFLGVTVAPLDHTLLSSARFIGEGVRIYSVEPAGPADRAGVMVNDIVTAVDNRAVASVAQLRSVISSKMPGDVTTLSVWRPGLEPGTQIMIDVKLTRLDPVRAHGTLPVDQSTEHIRPLGIELMSTSTESLADELGITFRAGVIVERTVRGSKLARQIARGTTIIEIAGRPVTDVDELVSELRRHTLNRGRGVPAGVITPDGRYGTVILLAE